MYLPTSVAAQPGVRQAAPESAPSPASQPSVRFRRRAAAASLRCRRCCVSGVQQPHHRSRNRSPKLQRPQQAQSTTPQLTHHALNHAVTPPQQPCEHAHPLRNISKKIKRRWGIACVARSKLQYKFHFSIDNHTFQWCFLHTFCISNRKFRGKLAFVLQFVRAPREPSVPRAPGRSRSSSRSRSARTVAS